MVTMVTRARGITRNIPGRTTLVEAEVQGHMKVSDPGTATTRQVGMCKMERHLVAIRGGKGTIRETLRMRDTANTGIGAADTGTKTGMVRRRIRVTLKQTTFSFIVQDPEVKKFPENIVVDELRAGLPLGQGSTSPIDRDRLEVVVEVRML